MSDMHKHIFRSGGFRAAAAPLRGSLSLDGRRETLPQSDRGGAEIARSRDCGRWEADIVVTTYLRQIIGPIFLHPIRKFGGIRVFGQGQKVNVIKVLSVKELLLIIMCYYFILRKYII